MHTLARAGKQNATLGEQGHYQIVSNGETKNAILNQYYQTVSVSSLGSASRSLFSSEALSSWPCCPLQRRLIYFRDGICTRQSTRSEMLIACMQYRLSTRREDREVQQEKSGTGKGMERSRRRSV